MSSPDDRLTYADTTLLRVIVEAHRDRIRNACAEDQGDPDGRPGSVGRIAQDSCTALLRKLGTWPVSPPEGERVVDALADALARRVTPGEGADWISGGQTVTWQMKADSEADTALLRSLGREPRGTSRPPRPAQSTEGGNA
jgi:hypothetical protein